jgi:hypothetical protein
MLSFKKKIRSFKFSNVLILHFLIFLFSQQPGNQNESGCESVDAVDQLVVQ